MLRKTVMFYSFNVLPENEAEFIEYMQNHGEPLMAKYCKNWEFYKLDQPLRGDKHPQYLGRFEIESKEKFFSQEIPEEMKAALEKYGKVFDEKREWLAELINSN